MSNKPHIFMGTPVTVPATYGQMTQLETKDMEVKVAIETTFLGWLCAVTGQTPKMAMCHLYDLCALPLESLLKRNGHWVSRKVDFPNSSVKLKVVCGRHHDKDLFLVDVRKWEKSAEDAGLKPYNNTAEWRKWVAGNPRPREDWQDPKYNYVKCKFSIVGMDKEIVMSQHEMEHMVTETFLLDVADGE